MLFICNLCLHFPPYEHGTDIYIYKVHKTITNAEPKYRNNSLRSDSATACLFSLTIILIQSSSSSRLRGISDIKSKKQADDSQLTIVLWLPKNRAARRMPNLTHPLLVVSVKRSRTSRPLLSFPSHITPVK